MYAQDILIPLFFQGNGVVQIFCVLAVDGHADLLPEVKPARPVRVRHRLRCPLRLVFHPLRELHGQAVGQDNGEHLCLRIRGLTQDLRDPSLRVPPAPAVIGELCRHLLPCNSPSRPLQRDEDIPVDPLVVRDHEAKILASLKGADHLRDAVAKNLRDHALGPSAAAPLDDHLHGISQERVPCIVLPDKNILLQALHRHEAKALGMACEDAHSLAGLGLAVASPLGKLDFPFAQKLLQGTGELLPILLRHLEDHRQLLLLHRHIMGIADEFIYNFLSLFKCLVCHIPPETQSTLGVPGSAFVNCVSLEKA